MKVIDRLSINICKIKFRLHLKFSVIEKMYFILMISCK